VPAGRLENKVLKSWYYLRIRRAGDEIEENGKQEGSNDPSEFDTLLMEVEQSKDQRRPDVALYHSYSSIDDGIRHSSRNSVT